MFWVIGLFITIAVLIVIRLVIRAAEFTQLAHRGVAGEGTVIRKFRHRTRGQRSEPALRYEYRGPDGRRYEYKILTTEEFWEKHEEGNIIEIAYVPDKPSISSARYLVNLSREALQLPPLE